MTDHSALVAEIKAWLVARGQTWETNCDAFQITARVAWALRNEGAQLIVKRPEQNGCTWQGVRYSHDAIAFPTGWIDCLVSAGPDKNLNTPAWGATGTDPNARLVPPWDLDADTTDPPGDEPPDPQAPPVSELGEFTAALQALADEVTKLGDLRKLDDAMLEGRYALIEADLRAIKATQAKGLVVPYLGLAKPPA